MSEIFTKEDLLKDYKLKCGDKGFICFGKCSPSLYDEFLLTKEYSGLFLINVSYFYKNRLYSFLDSLKNYSSKIDYSLGCPIHSNNTFDFSKYKLEIGLFSDWWGFRTSNSFDSILFCELSSLSTYFNGIFYFIFNNKIYLVSKDKLRPRVEGRTYCYRFFDIIDSRTPLFSLNGMTEGEYFLDLTSKISDCLIFCILKITKR